MGRKKTLIHRRQGKEHGRAATPDSRSESFRPLKCGEVSANTGRDEGTAYGLRIRITLAQAENVFADAPFADQVIEHALRGDNADKAIVRA